MVAAGAYLRTLREMHGMTREDVAGEARTSISQLVRIEAGEQETRGSLLLRLVAAVRGDAQHLADLLLCPNATAVEGEHKARTGLFRMSERHRAAFQGLSDADLDFVADLAERLKRV